MSDLISRKELYRKLGEVHYKGLLSWGANEIIKDIIGECDSYDKWIPVSERLPEEDTKVYLVCFADGYIASIMYSSERWLIDVCEDDIIAWMPLPDPYKADMRGI